MAAFVDATQEPFLQEWDVVIPQGGGSQILLGTLPVRPTERSVRPFPNTGNVQISGKSARIVSPGVEQEGLPAAMITALNATFRSEGKNKGKTIPDKLYREQRPKPLLLIHIVRPKVKPHEAPLPDLIALGPSFREFDDSNVATQVEYRINLVELRSKGPEEDDEDLGDDEIN